ncbi:hypothetical protein KAR91_51670 [Candidatus Pacearchaeota archaeon]|nr:hypothetical protein [Candidatus Pacearchaeota archaeon]
MKQSISMADRLRHIFNPLHVYCRLIDIGINRKTAKRAMSVYGIVYDIIN